MPKRSKNNKFGDTMHQKFKDNNSKKPAKSGASTNPDRKVAEKSKDHMRSKSKIKILNMYREKVDKEKMWERPKEPARVEPNRKWFGNVRTLDARQVERMRSELAQQKTNPYNVLLKKKLLPMSLISDNTEESRMNLLEVESFEDTFGPKSRRKKPKLNSHSLVNMLETVEKAQEEYKHEKDKDFHKNDMVEEKTGLKERVLGKGQSHRIWGELFKVIDSSDVLCFIIDARDPLGTRCYRVEEHLKKNCPQKHIVLVINKCDLVPTWVTKKWVNHLSKEFPTIAYHASINHPFGKGALIQILRQFDNFHRDKKSISVGFIGYPNVGKSSVINSLKQKKVCKAAPVPGETKVWQYITLTKRIYLIDCPGVVYGGENDTDMDTVLKGVVRAERLDDPTMYIHGILAKTRKQDIQKIYGVDEWKDSEDFLTQIAEKTGRLLKGGEPDLKTIGKMLLMDWQRGEIPYISFPPKQEGEPDEEEEKNEDLSTLDNINKEIVAKTLKEQEEKLGHKLELNDDEEVNEEDEKVIEEKVPELIPQ